MTCPHCHTSLPDTAIYCIACGRKQALVSNHRRHLRRPKSQGTITKLPGRRKPYWVRLPAEYDGVSITRKSLGCFSTRTEAAEALGKAMYAPKPPDSEIVTLQDIYTHFEQSHYFNALSTSAQSSHKTAWGHLSSCASTPIGAVNKETFQAPINALVQKGLKRETVAKVRNLSSLLCKEAMGMGLMTVNFGQLVQLPKSDKSTVLPFSSAELKQIWAESDKGNLSAMAVLVMCYTGLRPGELLNARIEQHLHTADPYWYLQTGSKTAAGRDRIIPIPTLIQPLVTSLIAGRAQGPLIMAQKGGHYRLDNWRPRCFNTLMDGLGIKDHIPYSCRHTYADLQKRRQVAPEIMMEVMGHEDYSTTVEHYQTTTAEDINRICAAVDGLERPK